MVSLALVGSVALSTGAQIAPAPQVAHAEAADAVHTWLTLDRPYLCEIWQSPTRFIKHCTSRWYLDARRQPVSDDPAWVPMEGALLDASGSDLLLPRWLLATTRTSVVPRLKVNQLHRVVSARSASGPTWTGGGSSGPYGLWTPPPGHPAYALPDYAGDPNAAYYGFCTWYAQYRRQDERLTNLGNAWQWVFNAPSHGLSTGSVPVVGATAVFQPGVEGAGGAGHVAHVEAVYSGGWFLISEMNMAWNGGGWGRVSFRYALAAPGVSFIY